MEGRFNVKFDKLLRPKVRKMPDLGRREWLVDALAKCAEIDRGLADVRNRLDRLEQSDALAKAGAETPRKAEGARR
jgi:hypothetical protein